MSLLDQIEVTDIINSAEKVADISPGIDDSLKESYVSWYDYVNSIPEFTHILAICLDDKYYDKENTDWKELLNVIDYAATANFISHSEPNVVVLQHPDSRIFAVNDSLRDFTKELSYQNGGPVLKEPYYNGHIRIKLAVEMPKHNRSTKYLNFLMSVRSLFGDFSSLAPRDGEFIEVYCREPNYVWRTMLGAAILDSGRTHNTAIMYGESNMAYFYKFVDNSRQCVPVENGTRCFETLLPEPSTYEIYSELFKRTIMNKMLDSGPSVSRQINTWLKRADKFHKKLIKTGHIIEDYDKIKRQTTINIGNRKYILNNRIPLSSKSEAKEPTDNATKNYLICLTAIITGWSLIILLSRIL